MSDKDLVSVIIPTYNRKKYIIDSVQSVLQQTYSNLECIVIDDGSIDGTEEAINQIKDERLRYYRSNVNEGQSKARNRGIELAKGQYIAFNDSDDIWETEKLQKQLQLIGKDKTIGMVYCRYVLIERGNIISEYPDDEMVKEIMTAESMFELLLKVNFIGTPTMLVRKDVLEELSGFNCKLNACEDYELVLRIAKNYHIEFVNEILVKAFRHDKSVSASIENTIDAWLFILNEFETEKHKELEEAIFFYITQLDSEENIEEFKRKITHHKKIEKRYLVDSLITEIKNRILNEKHITLLEYRNSVLFSIAENGVERVKTYIQNKKIKHLAIYGAGRMGQIVYNRLLEGIESEIIFIDQNKTGNGIVSLKNIPAETELIIASIHESLFDKDEIRKYSNAEIKNIQELI